MTDNNGLQSEFNSAKSGSVLIGMVGQRLVVGFKYISSGSFVAMDYYMPVIGADLRDFHPYAGVYANAWTFA